MTHRNMLAAGLCLLITCGAWAGGTPQGTAFTYQGVFKVGGTPANGAHHLRFQLFDALTAGAQVGTDFDAPALAIEDGLFTAALDFGPAAFDGSARWLQVQVVTNGGSTVTTLTPRQPVDAAPYALYALSADGPNLTNLNASNLASGTVPGAQLAGTYANALTLSHALNTFAGTFAGNGAGLTTLNATNIASGTLSASRLPSGGVWPLSSTLNLDSNTLAIDAANNRVGIGTASPQATLHLVTGGEGLRLQGPANSIDNTAWLAFNNTAGTRIGYLGDGSTTDNSMYLTADAGDIHLYTAIGAALTAKPNGSVGIGTTTPVTRLHVNGQSLWLSGGNGGGFPISTGAGLRVYHDGSRGQIFAFDYGTSTSRDLILQEPGGKVGIGTTTPMHTLTVAGGLAVERSTGDGMHYGSINVLELNLNAPSNGNSFVRFSAGNFGQTVGNIAYVSGGNVSYNGFMGSHYTWMDGGQSLDRGALVRMTGENRRLNDSAESDVVYGIEATANANDPACLGAYLGIMQSDTPADLANLHLVAAVGNGEMLVVDSGTGDIQPGDYLISGDIAGCAMKDDPKRFPIGYVVARAAQRLDWSSVPPEADGGKVARVSVFFESFVRSDARSVARSTDKDAEIEMLRERVTALEEMVRQLSLSR